MLATALFSSVFNRRNASPPGFLLNSYRLVHQHELAAHQSNDAFNVSYIHISKYAGSKEDGERK